MNQLDRHSPVVATAIQSIPTVEQGSPLFGAPWQAKVFALVVSLVETGQFEWVDFQQHLVEEVECTTIAGATAEEISEQYFECWLRAAERVLENEALVVESDLRR